MLSFEDNEDEDIGKPVPIATNQEEQEDSEEGSYKMGRIAKHLCNNSFWWLEDGVHNSGEMWFDNEEEGQYMKCQGSWGNWNILDEEKRIFWVW